jgi:hypothetical protein
MVAALAVTATVGYGVLTYAFAVLLVPMQEALGADRTVITGAQTVSLLAAALAVAGNYTPVMMISAAGGLLGAAGLLALRPARSATRTPVA